MSTELLKVFGQIAGLGGLALGVFMVLFREVIRKNIFSRLGPQHSYRAIRLFLILTWSLALIGLMLWAYVSRHEEHSPTASFGEALPFNTGWIFTGYYDNERGVYVEGPFAHVAYRPIGGERGAIVPSLGDVLAIRKERRVIIAGFKRERLTYQMISPPLVHDPLTSDDETGVVLEEDSLAIVRDIEISGYAGRPVSIWCRVAKCDKGTDGCLKALAER